MWAFGKVADLRGLILYILNRPSGFPGQRWNMSNNATLNQNQPANIRKALRNRCLRLAKYTENIKKDLERDCIPYWKLDVLKEDLTALADDLKEFA